MKVLFLDIDGVCNNQQSFQGRAADPIDPDMAEQVRRIVKETGCKVVLSSYWRLHADLRAKVKAEVCDFIDITRTKRGIRGDEVSHWYCLHPEITNYAILDDSSDFYPWQPLFKTEWLVGLTEDIANKVIEHLNRRELV